jgi:parallel beta helix pectate lyase-like protein
LLGGACISAMGTASAAAALFVSPSGSDAGACSSSSPCRSFGYAYRKAHPGEVVKVRGGLYGGQQIPVDSRKTSFHDVVFRPALGATVRIGSLDVHGSHVTIAHMQLTSSPYLQTWKEASDLTFSHLRAARFTIMGSHGVRLLGGNYGPSSNAYSSIQSEGATDTKVATKVRLTGVTIHDYRQTDGSSHVDCLHIFGARNVIIRRSLFYNCEFFAILFTKIPSSPVPTPTDVTIEDNFIDCCGQGYFSIYLGDQHGEHWSNFLVRNNSTNKPIGIGLDNSTGPSLRFLANIAPSFQGCGRAGVSAHYNIWYRGSRCGRHDRVASSGFRASGKHDFHLRPGAPAVDRGDPGSFSNRDYDGQHRPKGRLPDAGADERG